jgi:hypothetical protein
VSEKLLPETLEDFCLGVIAKKIKAEKEKTISLEEFEKELKTARRNPSNNKRKIHRSKK